MKGIAGYPSVLDYLKTFADIFFWSMPRMVKKLASGELMYSFDHEKQCYIRAHTLEIGRLIKHFKDWRS